MSPGKVWRESVSRQGVDGESVPRQGVDGESVPRQGVEGECLQARRGGRVSPGKAWRERVSPGKAWRERVSPGKACSIQCSLCIEHTHLHTYTSHNRLYSYSLQNTPSNHCQTTSGYHTLLPSTYDCEASTQVMKT